MDKFNTRLQYVVDTKKINQAFIVENTRFDSAQVSRWLRGEVVPRRTTIAELTDVVGCNFKWLADGIGEPFPTLPTKESEALIQSSTGSGISIQAGRDAKENIVEGGAGGLSQEEQELIDLIRQYGGSKTIESFKKRLLKIKNLLEDN